MFLHPNASAGNLNDWSDAPVQVINDRLGDGVVAVSGTDYPATTAGWNDIVSLTFLNQANAPALYLRVKLASNFDFSKCSYSIFIDADYDAATGYITQWGQRGAEYYWSGSNIYSYAGSSSDRTAWLWSVIPGAAMQAVGSTLRNEIEISISRSLAPTGPTAAMFLFFADTKGTANVFTDDITDYMPDRDPNSPTCADSVKNGLEIGVDCGGYCDACIAGVSVYDGTISDWLQASGVVAWPVDPCCNGYNNSFVPMPIDPSADIIGGWAWASTTQICLRIQYLGNYNASHVDSVVYIDSDANPNTGYLTSFNTIGADLLLLTNTFFRYGGTGSDWVWTVLTKGTDWDMQPVQTSYEMCFQSSSYRH